MSNPYSTRLSMKTLTMTDAERQVLIIALKRDLIRSHGMGREAHIIHALIQRMDHD